MRCRYCGSKIIHPETQHKNFSTGKAVAGTVMFGVIGAAGGFIGKDVKGYKCGTCGAFQETAMDIGTESSINSAVNNARDPRIIYEYKIPFIVPRTFGFSFESMDDNILVMFGVRLYRFTGANLLNRR